MTGNNILQRITGKLKTRSSLRTPGFSLIEVMVSVTIFIVIMISTAQIFKLVTDGQRSALATQNVQESLKYFLEVISKEIRTARVSTANECEVPVGTIFLVDSGALVFRNYNQECVRYALNTDGSLQRFEIIRGAVKGFISPRKIYLDSLEFTVAQGEYVQPTVTIRIDAWALSQGQSDSEINIQTSIASRHYIDWD